MGIFDGLLTKYGATMVGYSVLALPVFGRGARAYVKAVKADQSTIMKDYVRNSSLLINFSKAVGRLMVSYKEV